MNLNVHNLNVFIKDCPILREVSFDLPLGQSLVIMGPNGSGKTTLLKFLTGLSSPNLKVSYNDYNFSKDKILEKEIQERGRLFSYVPQFPEIQEGLTLEKYLELSRYPYWGESNFIDEDLKDKIVTLLGLHSFLERDLTTLSGGELKKAMIAGAFYQQTPLVFLDEPFQALDPKVKSEVAQFLKKWKSENQTTYVIVSHDFYWSHYLSDFTLFLKQGELNAFGETKQIFKPNKLTEVFEHPFSTLTDSKGKEFYLPGGDL